MASVNLGSSSAVGLGASCRRCSDNKARGQRLKWRFRSSSFGRRKGDVRQRVGPCRSASGDSVDLFSPAKINLFLRITKKREDGFHELASLFQTLAFGDTMKISKLPASATEDSIACNDPTVPRDGSNLVCKAADLFRKKTGSKQHFHIDLMKEVPAGAGLGGGSGNAATMLFAANQLCGLDYDEGELLEWSGDIVSDISFFFSSGTAYCTGRGEIVRDMPPLLDAEYPILLLKPTSPLSTGAVYKALDVSKCSVTNPDELLERFYKEKPSQGLCINDLEIPAFGEMGILEDCKKELIATGEYDSVFMSGSGSTMVCLGQHLIKEDSHFEKKSGEEWLAVLTQPVNREKGKWYQKSFLYEIDGSEEEYLINKREK